MQLSRGRRRGNVFAVRITDHERAALQAKQSLGGGPRRLGPWLVWRALEGASPSQLAPRPGIAAAAVLPKLGHYPPRHADAPRRVILDLCAGSGSWSRPYLEAGYTVIPVTLPACDVRTFRPPPGGVHGILAAPPCDQFSLARNGQRSPRDLTRCLAVVDACLRIVMRADPSWWALENPVGLLSEYLWTAADVFEPCDFGDPWTKRTALWGSFAIPKRGPFVEPLGGGPPCDLCRRPGRPRKSGWCRRPDHRARTPPGFARAFFEANP